MPSDTVERKLAAILSADVVGYSRLMAEDEDATVRLVTFYRQQVDRPAVPQEPKARPRPRAPRSV